MRCNFHVFFTLHNFKMYGKVDKCFHWWVWGNLGFARLHRDARFARSNPSSPQTHQKLTFIQLVCLIVELVVSYWGLSRKKLSTTTSSFAVLYFNAVNTFHHLFPSILKPCQKFHQSSMCHFRAMKMKICSYMDAATMWGRTNFILVGQNFSENFCPRIENFYPRTIF